MDLIGGKAGWFWHMPRARAESISFFLLCRSTLANTYLLRLVCLYYHIFNVMLKYMCTVVVLPTKKMQPSVLLQRYFIELLSDFIYLFSFESHTVWAREAQQGLCEAAGERGGFWGWRKWIPPSGDLLCFKKPSKWSWICPLRQ